MHAVGDFSLVVIWLENLTELQHNIATLEKILIPSLPCYRHRALILKQYYHATAARGVQQLVVQRAFQNAHLPCRLGCAVYPRWGVAKKSRISEYGWFWIILPFHDDTSAHWRSFSESCYIHSCHLHWIILNYLDSDTVQLSPAKN